LNERIRALAEKANIEFTYDPTETPMRAFAECWEDELAKFAELIVQDCMDIAKNWDDQLVNAKLVKESNAVGIVAYRIARQFGVEE
jgi:hypothetical protein